VDAERPIRSPAMGEDQIRRGHPEKGMPELALV